MGKSVSGWHLTRMILFAVYRGRSTDRTHNVLGKVAVPLHRAAHVHRAVAGLDQLIALVRLTLQPKTSKDSKAAQFDDRRGGVDFRMFHALMPLIFRIAANALDLTRRFFALMRRILFSASIASWVSS